MRSSPLFEESFKKSEGILSVVVADVTVKRIMEFTGASFKLERFLSQFAKICLFSTFKAKLLIVQATQVDVIVL